MGAWRRWGAWKPFRVLAVVRSVFGHPLHEGRRLAAAARWIRSLAAIHMAPGRQITIPYVNGAVLHWPIESTSVMICARYGLGEYSDMAFCLHVLRPADTFCDVGANAGVYTILAARGIGCRAIAFEPIPRTFSLLMQNVHANDVASLVDAHRLGIGDGPGSLQFTSALWSYNHVVDAGAPGAIQVDVLPLDEALGASVPFLLKVDVEGFEAKVVSGASRTLADTKLQAVVIEMTGHLKRYGGSISAVTEALRAAGLSGPLWYDPARRELIPAGTMARFHYNQIFIRDHDLIATRLREAPPFRINGAMV